MTSVEDFPVDLMRAISHGNRILDWYENLEEGQVPPEWMWVFEDELNTWFDRIKEERKSRFSSDSSSDDGDMMQNELARDRR